MCPMPFFNWEPEMSNKPGLLNLLAGKTQLVKKYLNSFLLLFCVGWSVPLMTGRWQYHNCELAKNRDLKRSSWRLWWLKMKMNAPLFHLADIWSSNIKIYSTKKIIKLQRKKHTQITNKFQNQCNQLYPASVLEPHFAETGGVEKDTKKLFVLYCRCLSLWICLMFSMLIIQWVAGREVSPGIKKGKLVPTSPKSFS